MVAVGWDNEHSLLRKYINLTIEEITGYKFTRQGSLLGPSASPGLVKISAGLVVKPYHYPGRASVSKAIVNKVIYKKSECLHSVTNNRQPSCFTETTRYQWWRLVADLRTTLIVVGSSNTSHFG